MKEETPVEIRPRHIDVLVQSRIGIAVLLFYYMPVDYGTVYSRNKRR